MCVRCLDKENTADIINCFFEYQKISCFKGSNNNNNNATDAMDINDPIYLNVTTNNNNGGFNGII